MNYCLSSLACLVCSVLLAGCGGGGGGGESVPSPPPASVTGSVLAAANTDIDSDVNALSSSFSSNDSFASAQLIANLTTLGGYLNQAGQGQPGRSFDMGDSADYYELDLEAGQSVSLVMAESFVSNDINLALFDNNQVMVDQSLNNGPAECVENPAPGHHFIRADILQGASNYTLSITSLPCAATVASSSLRLSSNFMPGEMLVRLEDSGAMSVMADEMGAIGLKMNMMPHQDYARVYIGDVAKASQSMAAMKVVENHIDDSMLPKARTLVMIKAMQRYKGVDLAEPNYIYNSFAVPNDPFFARQWHYPIINLPDAWDQAVGGSGAIVAVLDSGVLTSHPDLQSNLIGGYDFVSDPDMANDGGGIDADPSDPGDSLIQGGSTFHGSHVAGIVAALANNNVGLPGAAFYDNIKVMPLRVLGVRGGTLAGICEALRYAARLPNVSNTLPASTADIANLSLGGASFSQFLQDCIDQVRAEGVIIVAAAGNAASSVPSYPAAHNGVVSVSAVDLSKNLASYSSFGSTVDVAAPGGDAVDDDGDGVIDGIYSTVGDDSSGVIVNTYGYLIGTSMAAPHVSAVAALMKSVAPTLTPSQFDAYLSAGQLSDDIGAAGRDDNFGYGLINANKAVLRAQGFTSITPILSAAPSGINFGLTGVSTQFNISNVGGGSLTVNTLTENSGGWLSVSGPGGAGEGVYTLIADRNHPILASPGSYSATLSFSSAAGNLDLPVLLQVLQSGQIDTGNAGRQIVTLFSLTAEANDRSVAMEAEAGRYDFRFDDVRPDSYILFSSSDNDNDNDLSIFCDTGESCGFFGAGSLLFVLEVGETGDVDAGSFFAGYSFVNPVSVSAGSSPAGIAQR